MGFKSLSFQITTSFLGSYAFNSLNYGFLRLWQNHDVIGLNRPWIWIQQSQKHIVNMVRPPDQKKKFFLCGCVIKFKKRTEKDLMFIKRIHTSYNDASDFGSS